jgi:hypothetical protein
MFRDPNGQVSMHLSNSSASLDDEAASIAKMLRDFTQAYFLSTDP